MPLMVLARPRVQMPSFTLVLTSEHGYPHRQSAIIETEPCMLPTAPAHLMKTIDLRDVSGDNRHFNFGCGDASSADVDSQTVFEAKRPMVSHGIQKADNVVKLHFSTVIQKFNLLKQKLLPGMSLVPVPYLSTTASASTIQTEALAITSATCIFTAKFTPKKTR